MISANSTSLTLNGCETNPSFEERFTDFCHAAGTITTWGCRREVLRQGFQRFTMEPATTISLHMSNVETIPGKTIRASLGLVTGSTVRAKHIGKDIFAGLKNIVGGELKAYTELLNESRNEAIQRMMMQAHSMGANGVVNVRFATSNVAAGASELFCYGTAVVVE